MDRYAVLKDMVTNEAEVNPTFTKPFKIITEADLIEIEILAKKELANVQS